MCVCVCVCGGWPGGEGTRRSLVSTSDNNRQTVFDSICGSLSDITATQVWHFLFIDFDVCTVQVNGPGMAFLSTERLPARSRIVLSSATAVCR